MTTILNQLLQQAQAGSGMTFSQEELATEVVLAAAGAEPSPTVSIKSDEPNGPAIEVVAEIADGEGATLEELNVEINIDTDEQEELEEAAEKLSTAEVSLESLVDYLKMSMEADGDVPVDMTVDEVTSLTGAANDIIDEVGGETITISTEANDVGVVEGSTAEAKKTIGDRAKQIGAAVVEGVKKALAGLGDLWTKLFDAATKARGRADGILAAIAKDGRSEFKVTLTGQAVQLKDIKGVADALKSTASVVLGSYSKAIAAEARKATTGDFFQTFPAVPKAHGAMPGNPSFDEKGAFTWSFKSLDDKPLDVTYAKTALSNSVESVRAVMDLVLRYRSDWNIVEKALEAAVKQMDQKDDKAQNARKAVQESVRLISTGPRRFTTYAGQVGQQILAVAARAVKGQPAAAEGENKAD